LQYPLALHTPIVHNPKVKWPWQTQYPPLGEPELTASLRARLDKLEEGLKLQERGLKALELDWQEWFDKFRLMYARLSKRMKDAANAEGNGAEPAQDAPGRTNRPSPYLGPSRRNY